MILAEGARQLAGAPVLGGVALGCFVLAGLGLLLSFRNRAINRLAAEEGIRIKSDTGELRDLAVIGLHLVILLLMVGGVVALIALFESLGIWDAIKEI